MSNSAISLVQSLPRVGRVSRKPQHRFNTMTRPFQIQPMFLAPVLPGETLKNLLLQSRVVSDPIKNPLIGWWHEYYFFYVKLRDLEERDDFTAMMIEPDKVMSSLKSPASIPFYHPAQGINFTKLCLKRVVQEYFRDEGDAWDAFTVDDIPLAALPAESWLESAKKTSDIPPDDQEIIGSEDVHENIPVGFEAAHAQWHHMRALKMTDATFEDYLKTFGVTGPAKVKEETHRPELIRYIKDWTYPSNAVNAVDGSVASACSWSIAERADKDRFFAEPGFLFGVSVTRPKVYLSALKGSLAHYMDNPFSWLPAMMNDDPYTSLRNFAAASGPMPNQTEGYWVDVRDLFIYGDQMINYDMAASGYRGDVAKPTATMQKRYADSSDINALFSAPAVNKIRSDGVVSLNILGKQRDVT